MKNWIALAFVCFIPFSVASGQVRDRKPGLVLTGAITYVTPVYNSDPRGPLFSYRVGMIMQVRNDGDSPLIVFHPRSSYLSKRAVLLDNFPSNTDSTISTRPTPWIKYWEKYYKEHSLKDPFPTFLRGLDMPSPVNGATSIEPGRHLEFAEELLIDDGYRLEVRSRQSLSDALQNMPKADCPALRVEYHLTAKGHRNDGFLKTLRERWKRFGDLVLESNGDFYLRSDPIINPPG